ncbi:hypothetical protein GGS20DRAFT_568993 [Poronia punctata]|nr:hypothetical protein GGS20DRAFT_568993 [Poronia punctata]
MSFFSGTTRIIHASPIPTNIKKEKALALLHNHEFLLLADPHHASHEPLPLPIHPLEPSKHYKITKSENNNDKIKIYKVIDNMPNPVWTSNVVSTEEFVDTEEGVWVRIRSPLGVVMETLWSIRVREKKEEQQEEGEGELELVEDVTISASRLVLGIVKGQVEGNWKGIHQKFIDRLVGDAEAGHAGK